MTSLASPSAVRHRRVRLGRRIGPPELSVKVAAAILALIVLAALFPALLASKDPATINPGDGLLGTSAAHPLGTDQLGRDVLARVIHGARSALVGPLIVATATLTISTVLSLLAGFHGGWVDGVIGRVVDALYSLPPLLVAIVLVGVFGGGYWLAIGVLIVLNVPHNVRLLRAAVLERRGLPYIEAAVTLGVSKSQIMLRHLLPAIAPIVVASFFLRFTYGLIDLSSLSFLGLGVPPGSADWGRMLAENRAFVFEAPWGAVGPGLALVLTGVSANLVGDHLYERYERRGRAR